MDDIAFNSITEYYFYISLCLTTDQRLRMCQIDYIVYYHISIKNQSIREKNKCTHSFQIYVVICWPNATSIQHTKQHFTDFLLLCPQTFYPFLMMRVF